MGKCIWTVSIVPRISVAIQLRPTWCIGNLEQQRNRRHSVGNILQFSIKQIWPNLMCIEKWSLIAACHNRFVSKSRHVNYKLYKSITVVKII